MKVWIILIAIVLAAGGGAYWYFHRDPAPAVTYQTAAVKHGDLLATIAATGTIEPEELVDVGAQVSGQILRFGTGTDGKPIDYGSQVQEGKLLARIDDSVCLSTVATAQASVAQAKAGVLAAKANLVLAKANRDKAKNDWERAQKIGPSAAIAQSDYDKYRYTYEGLEATVDQNEAALAQAGAAVTQAEITLQIDQQNLGYCTINSPVTGVVIDRRVNVGQTVVSGLNAPSLFLIAKDLRRMQIWVPVNEADIGSIHAGQGVTFNVDAFPGQVFRGEVGKVRLNASPTQNVVTYTVEVLTDNSSGRLLPYLTANAKFEVARRHNVMVVANAALRWLPSSPDEVAPAYRQAYAGGDKGADRSAASEPASMESASASSTAPATAPAIADKSSASSMPATQEAGAAWTHGTVYVTEGAFVRPIKVRVGISDGTASEVECSELNDGTGVVIAEQRSASSAPVNPFAPKR